MSLLNARASKMSGSRIALSKILTISCGVQTQSSHVTTLTASTLRPGLKMPGKHSYSPKSRTKVARGDQQRGYLRRYNGISLRRYNGSATLLAHSSAGSKPPQCVQEPAKRET